MKTDPELMSKYCAGERQAFYELYDRLAPRLRAYLRRLTRDAARADDLVQLAFMRLHENRGAYIAGAEPKAWLFAIAHRAFIDEQRHKQTQRRHAPALSHKARSHAHITGVRESQVTEPLDVETIAATKAAVESLPAEQREAVKLTKLEGRSVAEAARIAGTTSGAIKQRVHRGYKKLRTALGGGMR